VAPDRWQRSQPAGTARAPPVAPDRWQRSQPAGTARAPPVAPDRWQRSSPRERLIAWRLIAGSGHSPRERLIAWRLIAGSGHSPREGLLAWRLIAGSGHSQPKRLLAWRLIAGSSLGARTWLPGHSPRVPVEVIAAWGAARRATGTRTARWRRDLTSDRAKRTVRLPRYPR